MRISSSWLTLGASLSLLIPAWTANAQELSLLKVAAASQATTSETAKSPQLPTLISSTEPAIVPPSSNVTNSGQLDPEQTLVVPTTPSQVKLDITKPVTLDEVIELAEKTNSDWIQARIAVDKARAALQGAEAGRAPTVTGTVQYSYSDSAQARLSIINNNLSSLTSSSTSSSTSSRNTTSNPLTGTLGINYTLFDSGVNDATIAAAENNLRIAELNLNQARQTVRLSVVTDYYNLQNADETIRIQRKAVENAERSLKDTQSREQAGVGTKFDVLQAQVSLANAKQNLLNAEAAQLVARRELARILNYAPTIEITAADKITPVPVWKLPIEESILLAVRNRAELDTQKLQREVARNNANVALAKLGPQISLFANFNTASEFTSGGGIGTGYQVGATLNWTLYDGGRTSAQVDQFKADQATAESKFEQAARQARYDVESAYINQQSRFKQIDTATLAVKQAEEALRLARLRLDAGVGTQLEVLTAESDFTQADVNRVQAIIGYNQARANLERAVAGL